MWFKTGVLVLDIVLLLVARAKMDENISSSTYLEYFTKLRRLIQGRLDSANKIPPKYYSFQIPIRLNFEPLQIIFVDEVTQTIMISSSITLVWLEPVVTWQPADYGGIDSVEIDTEYFWTPTIYIPKTSDASVKLLALTDKVELSYKGIVSTLVPIITTTLCNLDLTFFPYDKHACSMIFVEANMYNLTHLDLPPKDISFYFGTNAAWILAGYRCATQHSHYTPTFDYIICSIEMTRRSAFYVVNLIGPMAMTSAVTLVVFWLPAKAGEKMTFVVSMFLSSSVFYNYILDIMPRSMENPPRLNLLLVFNGILIMLATAATTFTLRRYEQQKETDQWEAAGSNDSGAEKKKQIKKTQHDFNDSRVFFRRRNNSVAPELVDQINRSRPSLDEANLSDRKVSTGQNKTRRLSYEQLDTIFFVLMSLLTIVVWLLIFFA